MRSVTGEFLGDGSETSQLGSVAPKEVLAAGIQWFLIKMLVAGTAMESRLKVFADE